MAAHDAAVRRAALLLKLPHVCTALALALVLALTRRHDDHDDDDTCCCGQEDGGAVAGGSARFRARSQGTPC
eukprot:96831-Chlamydomonas_euryale.AAC.2